MLEITLEQFEEKIQSRTSLFYLFVQTPLCGTCKVSKKIVKVAMESIDHSQVYSININESPQFAQKWKIESVPALLVFKKGFNVERIYAFHSVSYIFNLFKRYDALFNVNQLREDE